LLQQVGNATSCRLLVVVLRVLGVIDLLSLGAVVMPVAWMQSVHAWAGLGQLPAEPIVGYLARSASVLYALYGVLLIYMSWDVLRYWRLIRLCAITATVQGLVIIGIDVAEGMPLWWTLAEGPSLAASGLLLLAIQAAGGARA
jgi:hypothetical protein